jgi:uncharacterized protein (TIGR02452 family)
MPTRSSLHTYTEHDLSVGNEQEPLSFPVDVENNDCLHVAQKLGSCCVLNMACASKPGGGFLGGAGAQEENLCRRSNYYQSLRQVQYPLPLLGAVFTPDVEVFRDSEAHGYKLLDRTFSVNMLAVAADNRKLNFGTDPLHLTQAERKQMVYTVRSLLRAAVEQQQRVLVLGALGCGAFNNPPSEVATVFRQVLSERQFVRAFNRVVFAILDDHNAFRAHNPEGNLVPFKQAFGGPQSCEQFNRYPVVSPSSAAPLRQEFREQYLLTPSRYPVVSPSSTAPLQQGFREQNCLLKPGYEHKSPSITQPAAALASTALQRGEPHSSPWEIPSDRSPKVSQGPLYAKLKTKL